MKTSPKRRISVVVCCMMAFGLLSFARAGASVARVPRPEARDVALSAGPGVSRVERMLTLPIRANLLGVTYTGDEATVQLRYRVVGKGWSAWETVEASDIGPDGFAHEGVATRKASEPVWVGTADRVAVRVEAVSGRLHDVRLHAINTLGNAKPRSWALRALASAGSWLSKPLLTASPVKAVPARPSIVTRAGWGADERWRRCCPRYAPTVEVAFIHHTVSPNNYSWSEAPALMRAIYRYHRYSLDYDDIAYNFVVDRFGRVFEGRAGGVDRTVIGAHTEGMNSKTTGIALLGTFSSAYPSSGMMVSLKKLLAWKLDVHHIPPFGVVQMTSGGSNKLRKGQVVSMNRISGHRDAQATDCPGNRIYAQLPDIRKTITPWGAPKFYLNSSPLVLRRDGDGVNETVGSKIWLSSQLNYRFTFKDQTGNITKVAEGSGTVGEASWDGIQPLTQASAQTGTGTLTIEAWNASGTRATPATVPIYVVSVHPAATLLSDETTVTFIDDEGRSRSVGSAAVFASWFRNGESVSTAPAELARYTPSTPLGFRDGTLLKTPDGKYHIVTAGMKRTFADTAIFNALGYTDEIAIPAPQAEADALQSSTPVSNAAAHPDGSVVVDGNKVSWVVTGGQKRKVPSLPVRRSWYRDGEVVPATAADMALPEGQGITFRPGTLLKTPDAQYWLVSQGTRRVFVQTGFMSALGYRTSAALSTPWADIMILPYGTPIQ